MEEVEERNVIVEKYKKGRDKVRGKLFVVYNR